MHGIQHAKFLSARRQQRSDLLLLAKEIAKLHADYVSAAIAARGPDDSSGFAKQHWLGHIATQLVRDGGIYDTFAIERLHRRVKAHAKPLTNTICFERTILERVTADHCFDFARGHDEVQLGVHTPILATCSLALHGVPAVAASHSCASHGMQQYAAGDFVEFGGEVLQLLQFVAVEGDGQIFAVASKCHIVDSTERYWSLVKNCTTACVWDVASFGQAMVAVASREFDASSTLVLRLP